MAVNRDVLAGPAATTARTPTRASAGKAQGQLPEHGRTRCSAAATWPGYQAGSTFKIFTMLAALDAGMPLSTVVQRAAAAGVRSTSPAPGEPSRAAAAGARRTPAASMTGRQTMWSGFGKSVNTYFVQLEQKVGADKAVRMAERLGPAVAHRHRPACMASPAQADGWGAFTLGVADTTPLEMANAYATVAADGRYCEPLPVLSITDAGRHAGQRTKGSRGRRAALQAGGHAGGGPGGRRRGPLRDRLRRGARLVRRLVDGAGRVRRWSGGRWPARPAPPTAPGRRGSSASRRSWRRPASSPTRTTRSTRSATASRTSRSTRWPQTLRDALQGQPSATLHAAVERDHQLTAVRPPELAAPGSG